MEYFTQEEAQQHIHQRYTTHISIGTNREGKPVELPPATGRVMYMVPADAWLIGIVWDHSDHVEWIDKEQFEKMFSTAP